MTSGDTKTFLLWFHLLISIRIWLEILNWNIFKQNMGGNYDIDYPASIE